MIDLIVVSVLAVALLIALTKMPAQVETSYRIGIIADTQYADTEDGTTFDKTMVRRYRQSLQILESAVQYFNNHSVSYGIQLGDVLDSRVKRLQMAERCLNDILTVTEKSTHPWSYCVGNHDLDAIDREKFLAMLVPQNRLNSISGDVLPQRLYYDVAPIAGYRFLFLDGYELSTLSPTSQDHLEQSNALLSQKNKNLVRHDGDWFVDLAEVDMKYVPYNGGMSQEQLKWARDTLQYAQKHSERCIIFTHMPVYSGCCRPSGLMWNSDELLRIIQSDELKGVVVAVFAGHDHDGKISLFYRFVF